MKWLIGIGLIFILGAGIFLHWGQNIETVSDKQSEIVQEVYDPINDAEDAEQAYTESQSRTEERVNEIINE